MATTVRIAPKDRKAAILEGAIAAAVKYGWGSMTRQQVGDCCDPVSSAALVSHYFSNMGTLRTAVMKAAVRRGLHKIVAAGMAVGHKAALAAPDEVKDAARRAL